MDVFLSAYERALLEAHATFRELITGLDAEAVNWSPGPEMNSLAVLITHALGSQRLALAMLARQTVSRDRAAEFRAQVTTPTELTALIDEADARVREVVSGFTHDQLAGEIELFGQKRSGTGLLLSTFGHLREHLAHAELTRQLYQARP